MLMVKFTVDNAPCYNNLMNNLLNLNSFEELYAWFEQNSGKEDSVWVNAKRGKPNNADLNYIDVVYCALCFGWIDSVCKNIDGVTYQKLTPRKAKSHWTYLNIVRCMYLADKGLMTKQGLAAMPQNHEDFKVKDDIINELKKDREAWENFKNFPELYQRVRLDNIEWARKDKKLFRQRLDKLIETSKQNKMYGQWNDYGRL